MKKLNWLIAMALAATCQFSLAENHDEHKSGEDHMMKADLNGDGNISREEHNKMCAEHFDKIDTNHDGVLSKEEREAGHKEMREKMKEKMKEMREKRKGNDERPN